jgi:predicted nucleotidyltransferase component of viral defense system
MLNLEEILDAYPEPLRKFRRFLLREYLQYKILEIVFSDSRYANRLCFLGGTCLRIVHNTGRFSEDLDFDNFGLLENEFEDISNLILQKLGEEGFEVEIRNVYKGAFRCYIRFPNLLFPLGLSGYKEEKILIQLDTQSQKFDFQPRPFLLQKFDVFTEIFVTPPDLLLAQKCYAIINRKRAKGRDFFDAVFLFGKVTPNYEYLEMKTGIHTPAELRQRLLEVCKDISLEELAKDVKPFLFQTKDARKVELFDKYIQQIL